MPSIPSNPAGLPSSLKLSCGQDSASAGSPAPSLRSLVERAASVISVWRRRAAESAELSSMSDRELRDFGISRYEANTKHD